MNQKPKTPYDDEDFIEDELPPLAEDDEAGDFGGDLESFIEDQRDDGMSWLDDRIGIDDYDDDTVADELGAFDGAAEPTWLDGSETDEALEGAEAEIEYGDEYGWTVDSDVDDQSEDWDDIIEFESEKPASILDDSGEEGVDDEHLEIDMGEWVNLDTESEGEGVEGEDFGYELEFGMSFEQEMRLGGELLPPQLAESQVMAAWLGPDSATTAAVDFCGKTLIAAGAGLFLPSGSKLVATPCSRIVEEAEATSVALDPLDTDTFYLGTLLGGVLVSRDGGNTVQPLNGWADQVKGCGTSGSPSVSVKVATSTSNPDDNSDSGNTVLWVTTGSGHVIKTEDSGETWTPVLPNFHALALACDPNGTSVAILGADHEGLAVCWSIDGENFERRSLPEEMADLRQSPDPCIAVSGSAIAIGAEELEIGAYRSLSREDGWHALEECPRTTALAFFETVSHEATPEQAEESSGSESPSLGFLAGLFFAGRDLGTLIRSTSKKDSWVRVCDIGRLEGLFSIDLTGVEDVSTRIHDISVNPETHRQVALATGLGIFVIEMKDLTDHDSAPR